MNDKDKLEIAAIFREVLAAQPQGCPNGIDRETAELLKEFAEAVKNGKKTVYKTILAAIATAILGSIVIGIREFFSR